jgi:hypothetical protein
MKAPVLLFCLCLLTACHPSKPDSTSMQTQIDSLQRALSKVYKPGLGEFMLDIQVHHAKLWFAGKAENWNLSNFELGEIQETIDDIRSYCSDRPEVASIPMIKPALDSLDLAVRSKNISEFNRGFIFLTNTCNNCHQVTKHEFNVIQIPSSPPFSNQLFKIPGHPKEHNN